MQIDFDNDFKKLKLISNDIELLGCKIYSGNDIFYLTDKDDKYLGHIEYKRFDDDKMMITTSYVNKERIKGIESIDNVKIGLYSFMFKIILAKTQFKYIFGGDMQSLRAIKSWKRQFEKFKKKIYNIDTKQIEDFDDSKEHEYWSEDKIIAKKYLVGISESDNQIKWLFSKAKEQLELRESLGRIERQNLDTLVRFLGFDNDTAEQLIRICEFQKFNDI